MEKIQKVNNSNNFRLCTKSVFLTYSRCDLTLENVKNQLVNILKDNDPNNKILDYLLTIELHEEAKLLEIPTHVHVYLTFLKKIDIRNSNFFDLRGYDLGKETQVTFHPNVQSTKSKRHVIRYLMKHQTKTDLVDSLGNAKITLLVSPELKLYINKDMEVQSYPMTVLELARAGETDAALKVFENANPLSFLRSHMQIKNSLKNLSQEAKMLKSKYTLNSFIIPEPLLDVVKKSKKHERMLFIKGASGTGKTQYIQTLAKENGLNILRVNHLDGMRFFESGVHTGIFFDDFRWGELKDDREILIHLLDVESSCTLSIKHSSILIAEGIPRFASSNYSLDYYLGELANLPEISRRIYFFDIGNTSLIREDQK
jgi:hypothetical protein